MVARKPTLEEVYEYLNTLKDKLHGEQYDRFLKVLFAHRDGRTDMHGLKTVLSEVLKGHKDLILGFNRFLPKGHKLHLGDRSPPNSLDLPKGQIKRHRGDWSPPNSLDLPKGRIKRHRGDRAPPSFDEALAYVTKLKTRLQDDDPQTCTSIFKILVTCRSEGKSMVTIYSEVADLLKNYPDLLAEFNYFLP